MSKIDLSSANWEKISVYLAILIGFLTFIHYLGDLRERVAKLEVKNEYIQKLLEQKK